MYHYMGSLEYFHFIAHEGYKQFTVLRRWRQECSSHLKMPWPSRAVWHQHTTCGSTLNHINSSLGPIIKHGLIYNKMHITWSFGVCVLFRKKILFFMRIQGWGILNQFPPFSRFPSFQYYENTDHLLNIMVIFDRCPCSLAAETAAKYDHDSWDITYTFALYKFSAMEKLIHRAFATTTLNLQALLDLL